MTAPVRETPAGDVRVIRDGTRSARDALGRAGLLAGERRMPLRVLHVAGRSGAAPSALHCRPLARA